MSFGAASGWMWTRPRGSPFTGTEWDTVGRTRRAVSAALPGHAEDDSGLLPPVDGRRAAAAACCCPNGGKQSGSTRELEHLLTSSNSWFLTFIECSSGVTCLKAEISFCCDWLMRCIYAENTDCGHPVCPCMLHISVTVGNGGLICFYLNFHVCFFIDSVHMVCSDSFYFSKYTSPSTYICQKHHHLCNAMCNRLS